MAVWADLPITIRGLFIFPATSWSAVSPVRLKAIQDAIAEIYTVGAGINLLNSITQQITVDFGSEQFYTPGQGHVIVDPYQISTRGGTGFINTSGQFVFESLPRLLYHELVHAANFTVDDDGVWTLGGTNVWTELDDPNVDFKGPTVAKENVFASEYEGGGSETERPSYLATGYGNDIANGGNSYTKTSDGTIVTVDHVIVDNKGASRIDFTAFGTSKDLVLGGADNDILVGGQGQDFLYGDLAPGVAASAGNDYLFSAGWGGSPNTSGPETQPGYTAKLADGAKWVDYIADYMYGGSGSDKYFTGMGAGYDGLEVEYESFSDPGHIDQKIYNYVDVVSDADGAGEIFVSLTLDASDPIYNISFAFSLTGTWTKDTITPTAWVLSNPVGEGVSKDPLAPDLPVLMMTYDQTRNAAIVYARWLINEGFIPLVAIENFQWGKLGFNGTGTPSEPDTPPPPPSNGPPTRSGTINDDYIYATAANDVIDAGDGKDTVEALAGNDQIAPGSGYDSIDGGTGSDTVTYSASTAAVDIDLQNYVAQKGGFADRDILVSIENLVGTSLDDALRGSADNNYLSGGAGADVLDGRSGSDILDGGAGADILIGGTGNDTFIVDNVSDAITENVSEGTDLVQSSVSYTLVANVENLTLTGTGAINATGNAAVNILTGNSGDNIINGGAGADTMVGGLGNDTYYVDNAGDVVTEAVSAGTDSIRTTLASYALSANIENLQFVGTGAFAGTGNASANIIVGGASADTLTAADGNDTITGAGGNDTIDGGLGSDTLVLSGAQASYTFTTLNATQTSVVDARVGGDGTDTIAGIENVQFSDGTVALSTLLGTGSGLVINGTAGADNLVGTAGNDTINGLAGDDTLNGGAGSDTLVGGLGNDTYIVDSATDVVTELASEGTDTIQTSVTYTLSANVEKMILIGVAAINGAGNTLANTITGNAANNVLSGGAGNDTLIGGAGADALDGGANIDTASYETSTVGVYVHMQDTALNTGDAFGDTYVNIENLKGSAFADTLIATDLDNSVFGGDGNDVVLGLIGNDILDGQGGNDEMYGGDGNDTVIGGNGNDDLFGDAGDDRIDGGNGADFMMGGDGNDVLLGGAGGDALDGGLGLDTASYEAATAAVYVQLSDVALNSGEAFGDTYVSIENIRGSAFSDTLIAADDANSLWGGDGADVIVGLGGSDTLSGENGDDEIHGGLGDDSLLGGAGADTLFGEDGNDRLDGGTGNDYLNDSVGNDTFVFRPGYGSDFVAGFTAGAASGDIIELTGLGVTNFTQLQSLMTEGGGNTFITFADGSLLALESVAKTQLTAGDFLFL